MFRTRADSVLERVKKIVREMTWADMIGWSAVTRTHSNHLKSR